MIATALSLLKVKKELIVGYTAVVVGAGVMIALRDDAVLNKKIEIMNISLIGQKINLKLRSMKR